MKKFEILDLEKIKAKIAHFGALLGFLAKIDNKVYVTLRTPL